MIKLKDENIFISKKEVMKLDLLNYLLENTADNIVNLSNYYQTSERTTKNLALELLQDISNVDPSLDLTLHGNTLKFGNKFDSRSYLTVYKSIQLNYYQNSLLFQLFNVLFESRLVSIYDLSEKLNTSHSYLYKLINSLSKQFAIWDFNIKLSITSNKVSIIGDETEIRCFAYYGFTLVYNNLYSYSEENTTSLAVRLRTKNRSQASIQLVSIIEKIFKTRQQKNFFLPEFSAQESNFVEIVKQNCAIFNFPSSDIKEFSAIILWLTYVAPDLISKSEKIIIGEILWTSKTEINNVFKSLIEQIRDDFGCSKENMFILMWEYYSRFIVYNFFKCWKYKTIINISRIKNKYIDDIKNLSKLKLMDFFPPNYLTEYVNELAELTYSYLNLTVPLKIYLNFFEYSSIKIFVENMLIKSYSKNVLIITNNMEDADLIITNILSFDSSSSKFFFFTDISSKVNWSELGRKIQEQILEVNWDIQK